MPEPARQEPTLKSRLAVLGLTLVGLAAAIAHAALRGAGSAGRAEWLGALPAAVFVAAFASAMAVSVAARPGPISRPGRRRVLGSAGIWFWMVGVFVPNRLPLAKVAPLSLACTVWALWAWLGPRTEARSPAATRWFQLLAALLAVFAVAPWLGWAWMSAS